MSGAEHDRDRDAQSQGRRAARLFAAVEQVGVRAGVALIVVGFVLYAGGIVQPSLSIEELVRHWGLPSAEFLRQTGLPAGWGWSRLLGHSDMLALGGLAALAGVIIAAYATMLVAWIRERNLPYIVLVVLQLAVFVLAASGVLGGGR